MILIIKHNLSNYIPLFKWILGIEKYGDTSGSYNYGSLQVNNYIITAPGGLTITLTSELIQELDETGDLFSSGSNQLSFPSGNGADLCL